MSKKRNVVLYLDAGLVRKTRELGFNLSKTFENYLKLLINQFSNIYAKNNSGNCVFSSPGEIRTLVSGSKAQTIQNQASFTIKDIEWAVSDFWQYCKIEERLSKKVARDYKNVAKRLLFSCDGRLSRQAIREFLKPYLQMKPKTYNNIIDALRAFILRYLQNSELMNGFKHSHVPGNYERLLPTKEQLKKGFEALGTDKERAIYLFFARQVYDVQKYGA